LVGASSHPNWLTFSRNPNKSQESPRVITYINIRLLFLCFSFCKDIFDHRDISLILFFNCSSIYFLLNIYLDSSQTALKYPKNTEANINNVLIMTRDFNIRDSSWDPLFSNHFVYSDLLTEIADSLQLNISSPTSQVPIRYANNQDDSNSTIDLIFLLSTLNTFDSHTIYPEWRLSSDYTPLMVKISILKEFIQSRKYTIIKDSDKDSKFISDVIDLVKDLNTSHIDSIEVLESIVQNFTDCTDNIWFKHSKLVNITRHSKLWWNNNCQRYLDLYRNSKQLEDDKNNQKRII